MHAHTNVVFICKSSIGPAEAYFTEEKTWGILQAVNWAQLILGTAIKISVNKEINMVDIQKNTQDVCIMLTNNYKSPC